MCPTLFGSTRPALAADRGAGIPKRNGAARRIRSRKSASSSAKVFFSAINIERMAALSSKQSIKGALREINREQMLSRFESKEHECITAKVSQIEPGRGTVTVVYEGTELYLFRNEQIPGEVLEEGEFVKVYITGSTNKNKKPVVKISRTHKDLVKRLFEIEVPEIYDGIVEIKSISREAGSRTMIAVWS